MSNPEERACMREIGPDCKYIQAALYYWCVNEACCRCRGTSIPGLVNCPFYQPVNKPSPWWENLLLAGLMCVYVTLPIVLIWSLL
jgi:hypothetical protein